MGSGNYRGWKSIVHLETRKQLLLNRSSRFCRSWDIHWGGFWPILSTMTMQISLHTSADKMSIFWRNSAESLFWHSSKNTECNQKTLLGSSGTVPTQFLYQFQYCPQPPHRILFQTLQIFAAKNLTINLYFVTVWTFIWMATALQKNENVSWPVPTNLTLTQFMTAVRYNMLRLNLHHTKPLTLPSPDKIQPIC